MQALIPGEGLQSGGVLHRKVTEKLNSLKELAVRQAERNDRIERAGRAQVTWLGLLWACERVSVGVTVTVTVTAGVMVRGDFLRV